MPVPKATSRVRQVPLAAAGGLVIAVVLIAACSHSGSPASSTVTTGAPRTETGASIGVTSAGAGPTGAAPVASGTGTFYTGKVGTGTLSVVPTLPMKSLKPVPLKSPARFGSGVSATISKIAYGTVTDSGPGSVIGQATLGFTITFANRSGKTIDLDTVQVEATYGPEQTPGVPANQSSTRPLSGSLADGKHASGTYAFAVPVPEQHRVVVSVWYAQGKPTAVFSGAAR